MECIICGYSGDFLPLYKEKNVVKCPACNLACADVDVSEEELLSLYDKDYFSGKEYLDYLSDKSIIQRNFQKIIKILSNYSDGGNLFEIGSAHGFFLELARERWQVEGIDVSESACNFARNQLSLDVTCNDFLSTDIEQGKYDIFCMFDTIEHLKAPHLYIKKISESIKEGGLLVITTGDIGSLVARLRKSKWRLIHPPTHLYYFSKETLRKLLKKYGFKIIFFGYLGYYRSIKLIIYSLLMLRANKCEKLYCVLKYLLQKVGLAKASCYINLFDVMFIIAQKS